MAKITGGRGIYKIGGPFYFGCFVKGGGMIITYGFAAADECVVFAFNYGLRIGIEIKCISYRFFGAHGFKRFFGCAYFGNALFAKIFGLFVA